MSVRGRRDQMGDDFEADKDESLLNLREKTNVELRKLLNDMSAEEQEISYRRRVLHGRIDILRAELVRRLADERREGHDVISGADLDKLIEILANDLRAGKPHIASSPEDDEYDDEDE
jgi:hypothetical protein